MSPAPRTHAIAAAARRIVGSLALTLAAAGLAPAIGAAAVALHAGGPPSPAERAAAPLEQLHFGVRLFDVPVDEANNPRALRYIIDALPAGTVIRRRILIINDERRTAHFTVYAGAAVITGGVFIGEAGHARNELTGWITVQHPSVTLGPLGSALDLVTIRVPRDATRGEHFGVVWAEQGQLTRPREHVAIREIARVGVRVYLAVTNGVLPTKFAITSLTGRLTTSGQPLLVAQVTDTGGRAVDLTGQLRLTGGPGGTSAGPFAEQRMVTLAAGQSGDVAFALPRSLPAGPWVATVTLVSGLTTASARATILFGVKPAAASWASAPTMAWGGGMLLGLVIIAGAVIARLRRPRRSPA
jgi:hypothetical protein